MPRCINCSCTDRDPCIDENGACHFVQLDPPICSACVANEGPGDDAADEAGEDGMLCPASPVAAPHVPLFRNETQCYCARCRMPLVAA